MSAASTSAKTPALMSPTLPLPRSSAGHPSRRTQPGSSVVKSRRARNAPSAAVPMRLCPQAWPTPGSASYSPRIATVGFPVPNSAANAVSSPPAPRVTAAPSASSAAVSSCAAYLSSNASSGRSWMRSARSSSVLPRASTCSLTRFLSAAASIGLPRLARGLRPRRQDELRGDERGHHKEAGQQAEPVDRAQPEQRGHDRAHPRGPAQRVRAPRSRRAPPRAAWGALLPGERPGSRGHAERDDHHAERPGLLRVTREHDREHDEQACEDEQTWSAHLLRLVRDVERQDALLAARRDRHLRQSLDRPGRARERALGLVELLRGVVQVLAELIVQLDESLELAADLRDALLEIARALLHRETAQSERDDLEVREQRVGGRRDDVVLGAVREQVRLVGRGVVDRELVIDRLRRQIHEREIDGPVLGGYVALHRVDVTSHLLQERSAAHAPIGLVTRGRDLRVALRGELAVDRHDARAVADDRVHP